jgi:hypothetical protein
MVRVAEAALQVRGDAERHQIPKPVKHALASDSAAPCGRSFSFWKRADRMGD